MPTSTTTKTTTDPAAAGDRRERVAIALGANLGEPRRALRRALGDLEHCLEDLRVGGLYRSRPRGVPAQPDFLNSALVAHTRLAPAALLATLQELERAAGRTPAGPGRPRPLDLDLLLQADHVIEQPGLVLPHPRLTERRFVLQPLADVAADWIVPGHGTVAELLAAVGQEDELVALDW